MSEIISEINKKYEGLIKSYQSLTDRYKILESDFHNSIKDRDDALSKSNPVLEEKYDKLKRDYNSVVNERNSVNSKYSHIQRIHHTCSLQQQECESRNNLLQAQLKQEEKHSNVLKAKNDALKIEYDIMRDKFEMTDKQLNGKDKDYKNLKIVVDQMGKNNDDLRNRLKLLIELKPTLKSILLPVFALFVVGILPHLLSYRLR